MDENATVNVAIPGGEAYCSYCGSPNLEPYKVKYWKCLACGRIVITPIIIPNSSPETI